jgi:hypothetical protein
VAWVAIGALFGLAMCGLWALTSKVRTTSGQSRAKRRTDARPLTRAALLIAIGTVGVLLAGIIVFLVAIDLRGATSEGSTTAATTTPTAAGVQRPPAKPVTILVLNASGFAKPAADIVGVLRGMGYTISATVTSPVRATSAVQCQDGFADDAAWIVYLMGTTTANEVFPDPPPPEAVNVNCIVTVGKQT